MAKKKKSVEYSNQHVEFTIDGIEYKLIRFHPSTMGVDAKNISEKSVKGEVKISFAHLPKEIKQLVKGQ